MIKKTWTIKELLDVTITYLEEKKIPDPRPSAEILLAHQLKIDRLRLYLEYDRPLNQQEVGGYRDLIRRRLSREPVQYITGRQEFWSMEFGVSPQVLIPRPETELIIEQLLRIIRSEKNEKAEQPPLHVLDLGTGSGAIALAVASEFHHASIWASDISQGAIEQATLNAKRHGLAERIHFLVGDLFEPMKTLNLSFDFILTNPPYVASEDFDSLPPEIRNFEPRIALDGHQQGMFYIKKIIQEAAVFLREGGRLLIEMDPRQVPEALKLAQGKSGFKRKQVFKDYRQLDRIVMLQKMS